jgi:hypothetical protein
MVKCHFFCHGELVEPWPSEDEAALTLRGGAEFRCKQLLDVLI